ncbi:MAG: BrnA antitoxin family protein [Acidobacteriaceae bacterium]
MKKRAKSKTVVHELKPDDPLTTRQKREIQALAAMPEEKTDTSDIPELPPGAWKKAVRGKWYRPVKQAVSIRLDADVLAWLKAKGDGYQTRVNGLLRKQMLKEISE